MWHVLVSPPPRAAVRARPRHRTVSVRPGFGESLVAAVWQRHRPVSNRQWPITRVEAVHVRVPRSMSRPRPSSLVTRPGNRRGESNGWSRRAGPVRLGSGPGCRCLDDGFELGRCRRTATWAWTTAWWWIDRLRQGDVPSSTAWATSGRPRRPGADQRRRTAVAAERSLSEAGALRLAGCPSHRPRSRHRGRRPSSSGRAADLERRAALLGVKLGQGPAPRRSSRPVPAPDPAAFS